MRIRICIGGMVVLLSLVQAMGASPDTSRDASPEPNAEMARQWWSRLTNVYTPIGWKNHLFRFNVYYDGTVMADPAPEHSIEALRAYDSVGMQLSIMPSEGGLDPFRWRAGTLQMTTDGGRRWGYQGLLDRPTPVIWTDWRQSFRSAVGYILRQEVFAHVPGGREIETGTEPLFAWIRLSVREVNPLMQPAPCDILVRMNKPHIFPEMYEGRNCAMRLSDALYPHVLALERLVEGDRPGWLITEPDEKVRLAVLPGDAMEATLVQKAGSHEQDTNLVVKIPARQGAFVDLLVAMVPQNRETFSREMAMGREAALAECDTYWSRVPATAARIDTPERYVNEFLLRNAQYGELIAQRMPDGYYTNLTGSMVYALMWATPTTMFDTMLLDTLGYHDAVARYLEIFRATQGSVKPPGPNYVQHPGYFATPKTLTSVDWLSDHGAILHAICYHALLTDDRAFVDRWRESILKACEFMSDACAKTGHEGVPGLLPPAVATDQGVATQAVWNLGWHYRGLISAVALLERVGEPRAAEFAALADSYRQRFVAALREQTAAMPAWTDAEGQVHHLVPTSLSAGGDFTHGFYLDTGPLFLVYAGLLPADDPLMRSALRFFREGPNHRFYDPFGHHEQPPVLIHELSSCEPPASFNLFHSHQLADRPRFLEGLYSMLTGAHDQQTYTACETRGGITGLPGHMGIYGIRLAAVDDFAEPNILHLLRLTPLAWLKEGRPTVFEHIPTVFGPVTVRFEPLDGGRTLMVEYESRFHHAPKRVVLHVPPLVTIEKVVVNGRTLSAEPGSAIELEVIEK